MSKLPTRISERLIDGVMAALRRGSSVRRRLPNGGRVHIDRPLPFLCVYRRPADAEDPGTERLLLGEAAYVLADASPTLQPALQKLIEAITQWQRETFGACLLVEIWADSPAAEPQAAAGFRLVVPRHHAPAALLEELESELLTLRVNGRAAEVTLDYREPPTPPGLEPLLDTADGCTQLGLAVRPIYRSADGELFPFALKGLQHGLARALKHAFYLFAHDATPLRPLHYHELGRRGMTQAVRETDRRLAAISERFDLLLHVSPVNAAGTAQAFRAGGHQHTPEFLYRPRPIDPGLLKRELFKIPLERIEDPTLAHIFSEKRDELDRQITLVADRNTSRFLLGSRQIYGDPTPELLSLAHRLLHDIPPPLTPRDATEMVDARAFARLAEEEIAHYRQQEPGLTTRVELRQDVPGILVSHGNFLVGTDARMAASRVPATLAHEIGTHALTYYNGRQQPLSEFYTGMAGYEPMQEGIAVIAEYLVGGLDPGRLRLLAGRVVAVELLTNGAEFIETFRALYRDHGFSEGTAFNITMRVYRGGGFTKDAVYLDGLTKVLTYLAEGHDLERLYLGKIAHPHLALVEELQWRQVLQPPRLRPRFLDRPETAPRLARLRQGLSVTQLLEDVN